MIFLALFFSFSLCFICGIIWGVRLKDKENKKHIHKHTWTPLYIDQELCTGCKVLKVLHNNKYYLVKEFLNDNK